MQYDTKEREIFEKAVRVGANSFKGMLELAGFLPPPSSEERLRRLGESIELMARSTMLK